MKQIFLTILVIVIASLAAAPRALAHKISSDGSISILFHVDPNDNSPVAGKTSTLLFDVTDTDQKFAAANCLCAVTITRHGQKILSGPLYTTLDSSTVYNFSMPITFPGKDTYQIEISGMPKSHAANFQNFRINFDLPVGQAAGDPSSYNWIYFLSGAIFAAGAGSSAYIERKRKTKKV